MDFSVKYSEYNFYSLVFVNDQGWAEYIFSGGNSSNMARAS